MEATSNHIRDRAALVRFVQGGAHPVFLFFWRHTGGPADSVGKQCLSQWWPSGFIVDGVTYPTAEHFMMAEKARLFGDEETREQLLADPSPANAQRLGRSTRGFDEQRWNEQRLSIVIRGNKAKFGQNEALCSFLKSTSGQVLVEASPADSIWGIGLRADDPRALNPETWCGLNLLGFALMEVRAEL